MYAKIEKFGEGGLTQSPWSVEVFDESGQRMKTFQRSKLFAECALDIVETLIRVCLGIWKFDKPVDMIEALLSHRFLHGLVVNCASLPLRNLPSPC